MNKIFQRKHKKLQFTILFLCSAFGYFVYWQVLFHQDFLSNGVIYIGISTFFIALILVPLLYAFLDIKRKIVISTEKIFIQKPFKNVEINWQDILEFKKQVKGFGKWSRHGYFLKYKKVDEKQIVFADNNIKDLHTLIALIFKYAKKAKFIEIKNNSFFPFLRKYEITEWKNE